VVVQDQSTPFVRERLENRAQSLPEPVAGSDLAG